MSISTQERNLVIRSQHGDQAAFNELIQPKLIWMYTIAISRIQNEHDAEDAVQESLCRAWENIRNLHNPEQFHWWLRTIVIHESQELLRNRRGKGKLKLYSELSDQELYLVQEKLKKVVGEEVEPFEIIKYIHRLPEKYREIIYLRFYLGMSCEEISESIDISVQSVSVRIFRGKKMLLKELARRYHKFKK
ncbi:MAG: RNA polymerase sigma factor [bacterium]